MSMERDQIPGQNHEPPLVNDAPDDARDYSIHGWGPVHYVVIVIALLMLLAGALFLGELVGLLAAVLPGGGSPVAAAVWGAVGIVGLAILLFMISQRRSRR